MTNGDTDWKKALFAYVSAINEAALNADPRKLQPVPDAEHRERLARRLRAASGKERGFAARPGRSEMRARIERHRSARNEAFADVSIHLVRSYEQRNRPWIEERVEREKLRFVRAGGEWRLESVQPVGTEAETKRNPEEERIHDAWDGERKAALPSTPFLNPSALYGGGSRVLAGAYAGGESAFGFPLRETPYRRESAVAYAERWWNEPNPAYENFEVNCTNYVSQCLFAGGAPMNYTGRRQSGWWYKGMSNGQELWSFSWAVANGLQHFLANPRTVGLRAEALSEPESLQLGDVICYDWDGRGRYSHSTVVTAFTPDGFPLVNANTVSSRHRFWDYKDSYAWTEQTRYRFFHLADEF